MILLILSVQQLLRRPPTVEQTIAQFASNRVWIACFFFDTCKCIANCVDCFTLIWVLNWNQFKYYGHKSLCWCAVCRHKRWISFLSERSRDHFDENVKMLQKRLSIRVVWLLVQLSVRLAHANPSTFSITVYFKWHQGRHHIVWLCVLSCIFVKRLFNSAARMYWFWIELNRCVKNFILHKNNSVAVVLDFPLITM